MSEPTAWSTNVTCSLSFTANLCRHVNAPAAEVEGATVREVLQRYFEEHPRVRGYLLDDQGALRKHVAIFVNAELIRDRIGLADPVQSGDDIYVVQALSGG